MKAPLAWSHLLRYLSVRHTPGLEQVTPESWRRGEIIVRYSGGDRLWTRGRPPADRLARLFDLNCDPEPIARVLGRCPILGPRVRAVPGLRIPGAWEPFELVLRTVLGQQISVAGAQTIFGRLVARCPRLTPAQVAGSDLAGLGLTRQREATVRAVAEWFTAHADVDWPQTREGLAGLHGIGPWTLSYLDIRLGRDPDAFPASDLGLLRAAECSNPKDLEMLSQRWRPYRAYAAHYLWSVTDV